MTTALPTTVVHLEMRSPPAGGTHPPLNRQLALLRAPFISVDYYRWLQDAVGRDWHWVNRLRLSSEQLAELLARPERQISVLYLDGCPAGFFEVMRRDPETAELEYFGLMKHATEQGIGRWFLRAAIDAAWALGPDRVIVQTCTLDHPAALSLYQKAGFEPVAREEATLLPMTLDERRQILIG